MKIRPATVADFRKYYDKPPPLTMRALVGEKDGEIVGIGGYMFKGDTVAAFTDHTPGKVTKRDMIIAGRALMALYKKLGSPLVAVEGKYGTVVLEHYGFEHDGQKWRLSNDG